MLEVLVDVSPGWGGTSDDWTALANRAAHAAVIQTPHGEMLTARPCYEISVKYAEDQEVQALNAAYRNKDKATNVLSFPMLPVDLLDAAALTDDGEILLGDIVLARGVCAAEAVEKGISLEAHATHLVVHGVLHLLGHDHDLSDADAEQMEAMETRALASLGLADPYA